LEHSIPSVTREESNTSTLPPLHGPADGPVRDAVLREVLDG
jgi:hypothetical protein